MPSSMNQMWIMHVSYHPLCDESDANHYYNQYKNRNYFIGEKIMQKRKASQKNIVKDTAAGAFAWTLASHVPQHLIVL